MKIPTFLKWAGGKRKLIPSLDPLFPREVNRYFEPFLGGGSIFFYIKQKFNPSFSMISDVNKDLILTFRAVRDNPKRLIFYLYYFKKNNSKDFYYKVRESLNEYTLRGIKRCAAFIYLNKTCFNGLYRVNSDNRFNVPYGKYKNLEIFDKDTIFYASELLKNTRIELQDYRETSKIAKNGDFFYLDPCYDPLKKTSFANYTPQRFSEIDRIELWEFIRLLHLRGANVLLSNNNLLEIKKLYSGFYINLVCASRSINSKSNGRGKIAELVIKNY